MVLASYLDLKAIGGCHDRVEPTEKKLAMPV